jgi:hypothetical protein
LGRVPALAACGEPVPGRNGSAPLDPDVLGRAAVRGSSTEGRSDRRGWTPRRARKAKQDMSDERYPIVIEGDDLADVIAEQYWMLVGTITISSSDAMVVEFDDETVLSVNIREPIASGRPWTARIALVNPRTGESHVILDDLVLDVEHPTLPDTGVIGTVLDASTGWAHAALSSMQVRQAMVLLGWIDPRGPNAGPPAFEPPNG